MSDTTTTIGLVNTVADVYRNAADVIKTYGATNGQGGSQATGFCLLGAMRVGAGLDPDGWGEYDLTEEDECYLEVPLKDRPAQEILYMHAAEHAEFVMNMPPWRWNDTCVWRNIVTANLYSGLSYEDRKKHASAIIEGKLRELADQAEVEGWE